MGWMLSQFDILAQLAADRSSWITADDYPSTVLCRRILALADWAAGGNVPLRNVAAAGADAPTRLGRGEQAEGMGGDRQSDKSDRSDSPADSAGSAQSAPPAKKICADVLENDFALGECEDVREAVEMAVAEFGRAAVAEYCGVRPQEIAKAEQGYRVQKVDAAILPLLPNYHPENEEE